MFKPFKERVLTEEQIQELLEMEAPWVSSNVVEGSTESVYVDMVTHGTEHKNPSVNGSEIRHGKNKVITTAMIEDINEGFNCLWEKNGLKVVDTNYLRYEKGDHFHPHADNETIIDAQGNHVQRAVTAVTMLDKSVDLKGGILGVSQKGLCYKFNLEVGETAFFPSSNMHECSRIRHGWREVLVSWMA